MQAVIPASRAADVSGADPKRYTSAALFGTAGVSVKATAGRLYGGTIINNHATNAYYLFVHDKASAPVNGDAPIFRIRLPAASSVSLPEWLSARGLYCATGIAIAISTSAAPTTLTLIGADDVHATLHYM